MPTGKVHSVRAERAVKLLASGEVNTKSQALEKAGYSKKSIKGSSITRSDNWKALMQRYFPQKTLVERHAQGLDAVRESKESGTFPDYATRYKYLELGYKLHGKLTEQSGNTTNVQINSFSDDVSQRVNEAVLKELDKLTS